ncbi:MAG: hypothetical protein HY035_06680 [Nitrospirae bacterium]|nr:hypothetical protein [Nitrospirota bacterium]
MARITDETHMPQRDTKGNGHVIARSPERLRDDVAIFKGEIASSSVRNDRIEVFSGEKDTKLE